MPATPPIASLGLRIPNATFSVIGATAGLAAGWSPASGLGYSSIFTGLPRLGHPRAQRFTTSSGSQSVTSAPTTPHVLTAAGTYPMRYAVLYRAAFGTGGSVEIYLRPRLASGGSAGGGGVILYLNAAAASWTLATGQANLTIPASCHHHRIEIILFRTSGTTQIDLAFVGLGAWDASYGSKTLAQYVHPWTYAMHTGERRSIRSVTGQERVIEGERYSRPRRGLMSWEAITTTEAELLRAFYDANRGTCGRDSSSWPGGGAFPILLEPNAPTWPHALYVDFDSDDSGLKPWGAWASDDGYWELGSQRFVEVI